MFRGYITTPHKDIVNDVVTPECMKDIVKQIKAGISGYGPSLKGSDNHDVVNEKNFFKIPLSKLTDAKLDSKGVYVEGEWNTDHPNFNKYWSMAEKGYLDGLSIEFIVQDYTLVGDTRQLKKIDLLGYGHSPRPINKECLAEVIVKAMAEEETPSPLDEIKARIDAIEEKIGDKMEEKEKEEKVETPVEAKEEVKQPDPEKKSEEAPVEDDPEEEVEEVVEDEPEADTEVEPEHELVEAKAKTGLTAEMKALIKDTIKAEMKAKTKPLSNEEIEKKAEDLSFSEIVGGLI